MAAGARVKQKAREEARRKLEGDDFWYKEDLGMTDESADEDSACEEDVPQQ